MKQFALQDRVMGSSSGSWNGTSPATVVSEPAPVQTLQEPEFSCWVSFDEPQQTIDGHDAYCKAHKYSAAIRIAADPGPLRKFAHDRFSSAN